LQEPRMMIERQFMQSKVSQVTNAQWNEVALQIGADHLHHCECSKLNPLFICGLPGLTYCWSTSQSS
jgi:hypothetical protein